MADTIRYVNTGSTAGGDGTTNNTTGATRAYASLSEAESSEQGTISSGDRLLIYCDGSTMDSTVVDIAGWTINGELHIIQNNSSYDGTAGSGYGIKGADSNNGVIDIDEANVTIDGLEVHMESTGSQYTHYNQACIKPSSNATDVVIKNCVLWTDDNSHLTKGVYVDQAECSPLVENCVAYGFAQAGFYGKTDFFPYSTQTWTITNCSVYNCGSGDGYGGNIGAGIGATTESGDLLTMNIYHCLIHAHASATAPIAETGGDSFANTFGGDYNITNTADTTPGGNDLTSRTWTTSASPGAGDWVIVENVTAGSEDFKLKTSAENDAEGGGNSGTTYTTTDIVGTTRPSTDIDIGAFQISTASGGAYRPYSRMSMGVGA